MIKNLQEAIQLFKGTNTTIGGASFQAKVIRVNGIEVKLPMSESQLKKIAK